MYTFTTERQPRHTIVHYERFDTHKSGLVVPNILGSTILRTTSDPNQPKVRSGILLPMHLLAGSEKPELTIEGQIAQAVAAAQKPNFPTLGELREGSLHEWQDIFNGLSQLGEVPASAYEKQTTVTRDTPDNNTTDSGLIIVRDFGEAESAMNTPQEFDRFVASPDELDVITAITAAVQKMIGARQNPDPDSTTFL